MLQKNINKEQDLFSINGTNFASHLDTLKCASFIS